MDKILIIDSNSIMNRAYFALPPMVTKEGLPTNAIYGTINMLNKIKEEIQPDCIVATFDRKAPTFRHEAYKDYKAGRKGMEDDLARQLAPMKEIFAAMSISVLEIDGFEADDLIGTLSLAAEQEGMEAFVLSGDKDNLQLASEKTKVIITKRGISEKAIYDEAAFVAEFGITPSQFIDVKGLMGDKSDNIPGVPSIGEKTAFKLIKEYGSMEGVYENLDQMKASKQKENLAAHQEDAFFSKKLATIHRQVPIELDFEKLRSQAEYDPEKLREYYETYEFRTLLKNLPSPMKEAMPQSVKALAVSHSLVHGAQGLQELKDLVGEEALLISFSYREDVMLSRRDIETCYAVVGDRGVEIPMADLWADEASLKILKSLFEGDDIKRVGYNVKNAYTVMKKHGIEFSQVRFDVLMATYLLEPARGQDSLQDLIRDRLGRDIPGDTAQARLERTANLLPLWDLLEEEIREAGLEQLLYEVEQPLTNCLSDMELRGFAVDSDMLAQAGETMQAKIAELTQTIHQLAGEDFNISSPKQLGTILFEKMDLPHGKKTKTGYSTAQDVLEGIDHPIAREVLSYRQMTKLYSTYVEGLRQAVDEDGKIHSNFQQTLAVTGRLSSSDPNLQNIPIRQEMGRELRKAFLPEPGCLLLSSDYSQIELRVLAHLADDANMQAAFASGVDIHTKTAAEVFGKDLNEVTPLDRSNAKAVNFGIVYGMGDFSLAKDLGISRQAAKDYIQAYYDRYPAICQYFDEVIEKAKQDGFVTTILGRRRQIPEINARNKMVQAQGVRLAMNSPIQGSAADLIKVAMVHTDAALKQAGLKSAIILQVHDEIILNLHPEEEEEVRKILEASMKEALTLKVELKSDQSLGSNWYEA